MAKYEKDASAVSAWRSNIMFPKGAYNLRCNNYKFGPNSKGNPMVTLTWEIYSAEPKFIGDKHYDVNGAECRQYYTLGNKADPKSVRDSQDRFADLLTLLGHEGEWDTENPPGAEFFDGKCIFAAMYGKADPKTESPTQEQIAKGEQGDPIIDPVTRKPVVQYTPSIDTVIGLSAVEAPNPY